MVVQKGAKDGITDGKSTIYCEGGGSKRRAGGQVIHPFLSKVSTEWLSNTWALGHPRRRVLKQHYTVQLGRRWDSRARGGGGGGVWGKEGAG